jgi:D-aminopeptidase
MPIRPARTVVVAAAALALVQTFAAPVLTQRAPRARDLGVPFDGTPGAGNAITDVAGVTVGHATIIAGEGALTVGKGPVRTGVTAVLPRGRDSMAKPSFAGWYSQNGNGEMTGTTWIEESGFLEGPVMITNTHSVGVVRDAVIAWRIRSGPPDASGYWWSLPVVAETYDGVLNDINGFHARAPGPCRKATSAAALAWWPTASRAASARRRGW